MNLIEEAKKIRANKNVKREITPEIIDLVLALAEGEITYAQTTSALGFGRSQTTRAYSIVARTFIQGVREGWIKINHTSKATEDDE